MQQLIKLIKLIKTTNYLKNIQHIVWCSNIDNTCVTKKLYEKISAKERRKIQQTFSCNFVTLLVVKIWFHTKVNFFFIMEWTKVIILMTNMLECFSERLGDYWPLYFDLGLRTRTGTWNFVKWGHVLTPIFRKYKKQ